MKKIASIIFILSLLSVNILDFPEALKNTKASYGAILTVDDSGDADNHTGTSCGSPCTLRGAILAANAETQNVLIRFSGDFVINIATNLDTIQAANNSVVIDGESNNIVVNADSTSIDYAFRLGTLFDSGPIVINSAVKNITITNFRNGIAIYGDNNTVENVNVLGPQTSGVCTDEGERGIMILGRDTEHTIGNTLINNTVNCYRKGILLQSVMGATVTGNTITQNVSEADLSGSPNFNDVNPCLTAGIEIQGTYNLGIASARKNFITNNEISENGFSNPGGGCAADFRSAGIMLSLYGDDSISLDTGAQLNRISGNEIVHNTGDGIYIRQGRDNEIFNNHIANNGNVSLVTPADDTGNGIALVCNIGGINQPVSGNMIYRNTIDHNADNGVFIGEFCEVTGTPEVDSNAFNPLVENVIFENGTLGVPSPADDDGIGIDLQPQNEVAAFSYTSGNTNITENDSLDGEGGNYLIDTPVITGATYDSLSSTWTVEGTTYIPAGFDGSMVELYQVGCASVNLPADIATCDIDTYSGDPHQYGHGAGRVFLGRTYTSDGNWTVNVPSSIGFSGGLLTSTNTPVFNDTICVVPPTSAIQSLIGAGNRLCATSEFSANFLAAVVDPPVYDGLTTKTIIPQSIPREGTGTTILSFANTGNAPLTSLTFTDDLTVPDVTYVPGSCSWDIDVVPSSPPNNCSFSGDTINLSGFSSVLPGHVVFVSFNFLVPEDAIIDTPIVNTASAAASNGVAPPAASDSFTVPPPVPPLFQGVWNKFVLPSSIPQSGTGTTLINFTNTGNADLTGFVFEDDLSMPGVDYVSGSCRWAIDAVPSGSPNCLFIVDTLDLAGFDGTLSPGETIYISFDFVVPADAALGTHTNSAAITVNELIFDISADADFTVTAGPVASCSTTGADPDASFTINGQVPAGASIEQYAGMGDFLFESTHASQGDAPISFSWIVDGVVQSTSDSMTIDLPAGTHAITHVVTDCDGSFDVETLSLTLKSVPSPSIPELVLHKSISPSTDLHIGDLVTNVIQVDNPLTSTGFTMLNLTDELDGFSNLIPVCNYSVGSFPTTTAETCTVDTDGNIVLDLSADAFDAGTTLFIRYIAAVTGSPATYNNAVSYIDSLPEVDSSPADASASFNVEALTDGPSCPAVASVDASFTLNGDATPTQVIEGEPGVMSLVNASTTGDAPVNYHWYVNGALQSETAGTLSRSITDTTTFTLLKVDCDGSAAMDTLTILINEDLPPSPEPTVSPSPTASPTPTSSPTPSSSPSPSPSPTPSNSPSPTPSPSVTPTPSATPTVVPTTSFTVEKVIMNPVSVYSTDPSKRTIKFKSTIHNQGSITSSYNFTDTVSNVFLPNAVVNDLAGGLNESIPGLIRVTNISIPAGGSKAVIYTLTIKSDTDFPLSTFRLDSNADHEDSDFYPIRVKSARLGGTSNDDPDNALDSPDGLFVNLGERGTITLDLGINKLLIDGDGDDFAVAMGQGKITVAVSQDGRSFERLRGTKAFDLADADLAWARYVKITDNSVNTLSTATIDAVCLLNLGVSVTDSSTVTLASDVRTNALTSYVDITAAFDDPLSSSDCRSPVNASTTKQARTIELAPPAPVILPVSPVPTPIVESTPIPVQLPKTGPAQTVFMIAGSMLVAYLARYLLVRRRQAVSVAVKQK